MGIETTKKLAYLAETKDLIKAALIEKGQAVSDTDTFRSYADKVLAIETGGGSIEGVHTVTFMSHDGITKLCDRMVVDEDDCADPVARGYISAPTKASTVQYDYVFVGWATTPNGAWDENALKTVTKDKTVYAAFASAVRYYTVSFYDGETLLTTKQVAYGGSATYEPTKDGYFFAGWQPEPNNITMDTACYAQWALKLEFATASWADIARVSEAGEAANYFAVGDEREIPVTISGTTYPFKVKIVGLNHDVDSSGNTLGISCMLFTTPSTTYKHSDSATLDSWINGNVYSATESFYKNFPEELQAVLKRKSVKYNIPGSSSTKTVSMYTWTPCAAELNKTASGTTYGTAYEYFVSNNLTFGSSSYAESTVTVAGATTKATKFWLTNADTLNLNQFYYISALSNPAVTKNKPNSFSMWLAIGFCV